MGFLILLFLFFFVVSLLTVPAPKNANGVQTLIERPKTCPPHKWRYHEIKDLEGNTVSWKLACDICGPLKPINEQR